MENVLQQQQRRAEDPTKTSKKAHAQTAVAAALINAKPGVRKAIDVRLVVQKNAARGYRQPLRGRRAMGLGLNEQRFYDEDFTANIDRLTFSEPLLLRNEQQDYPSSFYKSKYAESIGSSKLAVGHKRYDVYYYPSPNFPRTRIRAGVTKSNFQPKNMRLVYPEAYSDVSLRGTSAPKPKRPKRPRGMQGNRRRSTVRPSKPSTSRKPFSGPSSNSITVPNSSSLESALPSHPEPPGGANRSRSNRYEGSKKWSGLTDRTSIDMEKYTSLEMSSTDSFLDESSGTFISGSGHRRDMRRIETMSSSSKRFSSGYGFGELTSVRTSERNPTISSCSIDYSESTQKKSTKRPARRRPKVYTRKPKITEVLRYKPETFISSEEDKGKEFRFDKNTSNIWVMEKGKKRIFFRPKYPDNENLTSREADMQRVYVRMQAELHTNYEQIDFSNKRKNGEEQLHNIKIASWNVGGIRGWLVKNGTEYLKWESPDIFCIQELRCQISNLPPKLTEMPNYYKYWHNGNTTDFSGVAIFTKKKPRRVYYGLGVEAYDKFGLSIAAEFDTFYVVSVNFPYRSNKLVSRRNFTDRFGLFVSALDTHKPVFILGDMKVAIDLLDIDRVTTNTGRTIRGEREREEMHGLLELGFFDSFRTFNPGVRKFTCWPYQDNCRLKNKGWRSDYAFISKRMLPKVCNSVIRDEVYGNLHCPIVVFIHV